MDHHNPLIVQSNNTLMLEVENPAYAQARDAIGVFAHLEKSPEHIHTYVITHLSLWNAAALGIGADDVVARLKRFSKYPVPDNVVRDVHEIMQRYGYFVLQSRNGGLVLECTSPQLLANIARHPKVKPLLGTRINDTSYALDATLRGVLKQTFIHIGYPVQDRAGYVDGDPYDIALRATCKSGEAFTLRTYQREAAHSYLGDERLPGGNGVVVLPCGAGKTVVGMAVMEKLARKTLILVTNITAARQWKEELLDKTTLRAGDIGEYSSEAKRIQPVTIATYQIITYRRNKQEPFVHFGVFNAENWGLIIYDEVHLLPAPVFKFTAELQARRRLGLTATLVREDGHEPDVFSLIGPKKFDMPWKVLEHQGWIAKAHCIEIRIDLPMNEKMRLFSLPPGKQTRVAYENPNKIDVVAALLTQHTRDRVLIMGQYLSQLNQYAQRFDIPLITGSTPNAKRISLYNDFRNGTITRLILSRVGNFAIDLPDANVAIQISGSFGSRQEEAQRLGRILRPKARGEQALFYSLVTRDTRELEFAMKRQLFLAEQGYEYEIRYGDEFV
jgi:DNA excision repair protein ERCC-3